MTVRSCSLPEKDLEKITVAQLRVQSTKQVPMCHLSHTYIELREVMCAGHTATVIPCVYKIHGRVH